MGFLTAAIGIAMILYPLATAAVSTVFFGSALIVAALAQFVFAFTSQTAGNFFLKLLLGVLYGIAGIALVAFPGVGLVSLTGALGAMLIAEAILEAITAFALPAEMGRGWLLLSAVTSLLLGIMILAEWPASSVWAIGTFVGLAVLMNGITRIVIASQVRRLAGGFERAVKAA